MFKSLLTAGLLLGTIAGLSNPNPVQARAGSLAQATDYRPGDKVWVRVSEDGPWQEGVVKDYTEDRYVYKVQIGPHPDELHFKHQDDLAPR
jgi:hypothetical protein